MAKKRKKASTQATEKTVPTVDETPDIGDEWEDETVEAETVVGKETVAEPPPSKPSPTKNVEASKPLTRMPGKLRKTL